MEAEASRLHRLLNAAISPPEVGAVNFSALRTLLHEIIGHLHLQDGPGGQQGGTEQRPPSGGILQKGHSMEHRLLHIEQQLEALDVLSKPGQQGGSSALREVWQMMQMKRRLEVNEEGVCKAMSVLQDLMLEVNTLKDSQCKVQDQIQKVAETAGLETRQQLEQKYKDVASVKESLQTELELLKTQMKEAEEKLDILHESLAKFQGTKPADNEVRPVSGPVRGTDISQPDGHISDISQNTQGPSQAKDSALSVEIQHGAQDDMTASTLQDTQIMVSELEYGTDLFQAHPGAPVPHNTAISCSMTCMDANAAPGTPEGNLVLPTGATSQELAMLYVRVEALERDKADCNELGLLKKNADDTAMTLNDLQEKLSNLNREMHDLRGDPDKLDQLQGAIDLTGTSHHRDLTLEEANLSATIQDIEKELKEMRKRQKQDEATIEQSLDDQPIGLQDQDGELIDYIQKTMLQLQEQCERLSKTIGSVIQDHELKQRHIDILYQTVENLDKNKADKELTGPETDMEADRHALESKVSRTHFDATTEHLSRMIQELLGKVGAQEQDWQRLLDKINVEMQNKLDRIELEPLKNILEQCWTDLRRQLQEHPPQYEADEAAGIRKQLIRRFHCISCDRTVDMLVPGTEMLSIPNISGLPAHRSNRPYTVFELNQIRQQSRSDRLPQLSDFGYTSSSRSCGGSHTLTFPQKRYARLQASTPCTAQKEDFVAGLKEEVLILGQDGHIYRGRRENHLPSIRTKDDRRSVAHQKFCDCNLKGEESLFGSSPSTASDIHCGVSKAHMKFTQGSEQPLPSIKDIVPPAFNQSVKWT
ncbi:glutamine-rich protein 2 isoform X2 [Dendropsophus ebraccatus]|uniref:glutamine-rich protein 2 isoform X2 n=1 Tax=Dendropsophus ebraccatus TaxID=150705 RepID=UPI003831224D